MWGVFLLAYELGKNEWMVSVGKGQEVEGASYGDFLKVRSLFVFLSSYVFDGSKGGHVFEIAFNSSSWTHVL